MCLCSISLLSFPVGWQLKKGRSHRRGQLYPCVCVFLGVMCDSRACVKVGVCVHDKRMCIVFCCVQERWKERYQKLVLFY